MRYHFFKGGRKSSPTMDGIKFDGHGEMRRYEVLKARQAKGEIAALEVHPRYVLEPAFTDSQGGKHKDTVVTFDFRYCDNEYKRIVIEDVKPLIRYRTKKKKILKTKFLTNDAYPLRKLLFLKKHLRPGMIFVEVPA